MKKIIITLILTTLSPFIQANYRIIIPIEQSKGGSLPDGSIRMTNALPEKKCQYLNDTNGGTNNTFWFSWSGAFVLFWDGVTITDTGNSNDYFISNNWKYTKGVEQLIGSFGSINAVCREAI